MIYNTVPWRLAKNSDHLYHTYMQRRHPEGFGFPSFDRLPEGPRKTLYRMLDPNPATRASIKDILSDNWVQSIECCLRIDHGKGHLVSVDHEHEHDEHSDESSD